jgi:DNA-binding HxlR family transcriptional regulator
MPTASGRANGKKLMTEVLGRIGDKWSLLVIEALGEGRTLRFNRLRAELTGISQKMLTQTLRQLERDGLVERTVHPTIPPKVDYRLTDLGESLGGPVCSICVWAQKHFKSVEKARQAFDNERAPLRRLQLPIETFTNGGSR